MIELPAPLVAANLDLRDFAFMPLDVVRLNALAILREGAARCGWADSAGWVLVSRQSQRRGG